MSDQTTRRSKIVDPMAGVPDYAKGGIPIFLASSISLASGATGVPLDARQLINPYRQAMVIDEIHFQLIMEPIEAGTFSGGLGGSVRARFKLGRIEISHDFIPIWNYGTIWDDNDNEEDNTLRGAQNAGGTAFLEKSISYYRWLLPKPLYVPAGNVLQPALTRMADGFTNSVTAWVGYGARRLAPHKVPQEFDVPYVASFVPDEITNASPVVRQSNELNLVNPFDVDLRVQRFTGRCLDRPAALGTMGDDLGNGGNGQLTVSMKDSYGNTVINNFTPWIHVFDRNRRAWTFSRTLKPKERYNVFIANIQIEEESDGINPQIAMIGTRRESLTNV